MSGQRRQEHRTFRAASGTVFSRVADETILLNYDRGRYFGLDEIGSLIWSLLQQPRTLDELLDEVLKHYAVDREVCKQDVEAFLHRLAGERLLD